MITITDKSRCCGCSACMSVCPRSCISMKSDGEGFLYPVTDTEQCIYGAQNEAVDGLIGDCG